MLQRTKGRILLALLVITGMAGTPKNSTLSQNERRFCVLSLKKSRSELIGSLKDLSPAQLSFKPSAGEWSIEDCIYHIAAAENYFNLELQQAMKLPARPDERRAIRHSDAELIRMAADPSYPILAGDAGRRANWTSVPEALESFMSNRGNQVRYVRNTTEDLRNHVVALDLGYVDCYQLLLVMTHYSNRHMQQIRGIMAHEKFPRS